MKKNLSKLYAPQNLFLLLSIIFGFILVFLAPPYSGGDEPNHLYRAINISDGVILAEKRGETSGGYISDSLQQSVNELFINREHREGKKTSIESIKNDFISGGESKESKSFVDFSNTVLYSPVGYIPQVAAVTMAKILYGPPLLFLYLARLFNLAVSITLVYFAIKVSPVAKWIFFMISIMPITIVQFASASNDALLISLCLLFTSLCFKFAVSGKVVTNKNMMWLLLIIVAIAAIKMPYLLIALLILIIPSKMLESKSAKYWTFIAVAIGLAITVMWSFAAQTRYVSYRKIVEPNSTYNISPNEQMKQAVLQPIRYARVYVKSLVIDSKDILYGIPIVSDRVYSSFKYIPIVFYISVLICIYSDDKLHKIINRQNRIIYGSIVVLIISAIYMLIYMSWNELMADYITSVTGQIRYFTPVLPIAFIMFWTKKIKVSISNKILAYIVATAAILMFFGTIIPISRMLTT